MEMDNPLLQSVQWGADGHGRPSTRVGNISDDTASSGPAVAGLRSGLPGNKRVRIGAVIAIAIAGGLLGWLLTRGGDHASAPVGVTAGQTLPGIPAGVHVGPSTFDANGVKVTAQALHQPAYWIGTRKGYSYQLERAANGYTYITYLPPGTTKPRKGTRYIVVATYPLPQAMDKLSKAADRAKATTLTIPGHGIAVVGQIHPNSVYVAYPNTDFEIEVVAPTIAQARRLVVGGALRSVPAS